MVSDINLVARRARVLSGIAAAALLAGVVAVRGLDSATLPAGAAVAQDTSADAAAARPKNVLLITIDTLRADHMSCYGYSRPTTPNLDKLFARGTRFEYAFSTASCTVPSHTSILTGLYPSHTSVGLENGQQWALDPAVTTLAELCKSADMYTAAVVSSDTLIGKVGLSQGFDIYDDAVSERNGVLGKQPADFACGKAETKYLKDTRGKPYFFWLHIMDPHGPYVPPQEWLDRFPPNTSAGHIKPSPLVFGLDEGGYGSIPRYQWYKDQTDPEEYVSRYDAEIAFADDQIAKFLAKLDERGLLRDTLIIVTADHGEALGEDNFYFAHSHSVGLDQVRVPLAFIGPGVQSGQVVSQPVSNMDIFATVCEVLGLSGPQPIHARSLAPVLAGSATMEDRPAFAGAPSQWGAALNSHYYRRDRVRASNHGFWRNNKNSAAVHRPCGEQLWDLRAGERLPLIEAQTVRKSLDEFQPAAESSLKNVPRTVKVNRSKVERERLRKVGYLAGGDDEPATPKTKRQNPRRNASSKPASPPIRSSPPEAGEGTP